MATDRRPPRQAGDNDSRPTVLTVRGPVPADGLGFTSMHEHVLCDATVYRRKSERTDPAAYAALLNGFPDAERLEHAPVTLETVGLCRSLYTLQLDNLRLDDHGVMARELADFYASGGRTVVEMSALGLRTDVTALRRLSEQTGVAIVAAAGLYIEDSWPEHVRGYTITQFAESIASELVDGIDGTDVRAGHIKLAVTDLSAAQEAALRGGARAALETGALVTVHPGFEPGRDGRRISEVLVEEGLSPSRIVIAHADAFIVGTDLTQLVLDPASWALNLDYHRDLLDRGVNISFDCFGQSWTDEASGLVSESDWHRLAAVVELLKQGHGGQLVLGTDVFMKMLTRRGGGEGYCRLTRWVLPSLRKLGVSELEIERMTQGNPARLLSSAG
jgi:phosphotriesterase-related protein